MKLKSPEQIKAHISAFQGLTPERKAQIADHLIHLPESHLPSVAAVLERPDADEEVSFLRGCFEGAPAPEIKTQPASVTEPGHEEPQPAA